MPDGTSKRGPYPLGLAAAIAYDSPAQRGSVRMELQVLKTVGQVAGIGGLALGVFLRLFRDIIRKHIFPKLPAAKASRLLRLITGAVWSVTIVGILAWVYVQSTGASAGLFSSLTSVG